MKRRCFCFSLPDRSGVNMLLEQLVKKEEQPPQYDWDSYYRWQFSQLAGREVDGFNFWLCKKCLSVNTVYLPARYGKCQSCGLIHLPEDMNKSKSGATP